MKYVLVTVGKVKEPFIAEGLRLYQGRIARYADFRVLPVRNEKITKGVSETWIRDREAARIREKVTRDGAWLALDRKGLSVDSHGFFRVLEQRAVHGRGTVYFIVGGPLGLPTRFLDEADRVLSLSPLTFTHELSALLLAEQLYRFLNHRAGEKYHK